MEIPNCVIQNWFESRVSGKQINISQTKKTLKRTFKTAIEQLYNVYTADNFLVYTLTH